MTPLLLLLLLLLLLGLLLQLYASKAEYISHSLPRSKEVPRGTTDGLGWKTRLGCSRSLDKLCSIYSMAGPYNDPTTLENKLELAPPSLET